MAISHTMTTVIVSAVSPAFPNIITRKHYVQFLSIDSCRRNRTCIRRCGWRDIWTAQGQMKYGGCRPTGGGATLPFPHQNHQKNHTYENIAHNHRFYTPVAHLLLMRVYCPRERTPGTTQQIPENGQPRARHHFSQQRCRHGWQRLHGRMARPAQLKTYIYNSVSVKGARRVQALPQNEL